MFSRFVNKFKKGDLDEQRSFQRKVHGIVSRVYPDKVFTLSEDPSTIASDGVVYGLTNLHARFLLSSKSESDLEELVKETFDHHTAIRKADNDIPWEEARSCLMPQLMPEVFVGVAPIELVHKPFVAGVMLGFVVDSKASYHYVNVDMLDEWGVELDSLNTVAFENLEQRSQGIEIMAFSGEDAFVIINTMDGFDAVRILSPQIREVISEHIGYPFFAGTPNRDFLICWSAKGSREFQDKMRLQISSDFDEQPYPLSRAAFEVRGNGEIRQISATSDESAINVEMN